MSVAFAERPPMPQEIERLRLILSTYQDGTGMLAAKGGKTLPGWRDFERAVALAFQGEGPENKAVFDVLLTSQNRADTKFGISCKMRKELNRVGRDGRVTLELSNSAGHFWDQLGLVSISVTNYKQRPQEVGKTVIDVVKKWHTSASTGERTKLTFPKAAILFFPGTAQASISYTSLP